MAAYLFAWNPEHWGWDDLDKAAEQVKQGQPIIKTWSITDNEAKVGDHAFLIKLGQEPTGIIASGAIVRGPYRDEDRNPDQVEKNGERLCVDIKFDVLLDPCLDPILRRDKLDARTLEHFKDDTQQAGRLIPEDIAEDLEKTWVIYKRKTTQSIPGNTENPKLVLYQEYSRNSIHEIFAPGSHPPAQTEAWESQEIVPIPNYPGDFVFFVTPGQEKEEQDPSAEITEEGVLTWQPGPSQALFGKQLKQLINHDESVNFIYLFFRTTDEGEYTYLGNLKYLSHHRDRNYQIYFKWQLLSWEAGQTPGRIGLVAEEKTTRRLPYSKNGKVGAMKWRGEWMAIILLIIADVSMGFLILFSILHKQAVKAMLPTGTAGATQTSIPSLMPISTPTLIPTSPPTMIPTTPPTETAATPAVPTPIFSDPFLVDNPDNWLLPAKSYWGSSVDASIGENKLKLVINCPTSDKYTYCVPYVTLLQPTLKDFDLSFDLLIEQQSNNANTGVDFRFRESTPGIYYAFHINILGEYYINIYDPEQVPLIIQPQTLPKRPISGETISFRIIANNSSISIFENGTLLQTVENDQLNLPGTFSVYYYISQGGSATISIQNFRVNGVN